MAEPALEEAKYTHFDFISRRKGDMAALGWYRAVDVVNPKQACDAKASAWSDHGNRPVW